MPTRRQSPDAREFRQNAFSSSAEYERGILGNLVAARCHKLTDRDEIAMLWWLQQISWREGGIEKFAAELLAANSTKIGTPSMFRFGFAPGQIYSSAQVRTVRSEMADGSMFPLKGEANVAAEDAEDYLEENKWCPKAERRRQSYPEKYPAASFVTECHLSANKLADILQRALVDPASHSLRNGLWNFSTLWEALGAARDSEIAAARGRLVETTVTRQISEELDFALQTKSFILIEGDAGIGKTEAARAWCDQHPGRAIYVRMESGYDETTLYRSIARRVGTACSYSRTAVDMRARLQDALQPAHLMVVFDESHWFFPQARRLQGCPRRLDWLRSALIDFGVPVALICTPQVFATQCDRFRTIGWNANQIQRRIVRTVQLPTTIPPADAVAVARSYFPATPERLLKLAAAAALLSVERLTLFSHLRKRVNFLAPRMAGASEPAILEAALREIGAPGLTSEPPERASGSGSAERSKPASSPLRNKASSMRLPAQCLGPGIFNNTAGDDGADAVGRANASSFRVSTPAECLEAR
jgi:hypothetical protein